MFVLKTSLQIINMEAYLVHRKEHDREKFNHRSTEAKTRIKEGKLHSFEINFSKSSVTVEVRAEDKTELFNYYDKIKDPKKHLIEFSDNFISVEFKIYEETN